MQKLSGLFLFAILISGAFSSSFAFALAPIAEDDFITTLENTPKNIPVLDNDSDIDGDSLSITSVIQPLSGVVVILSSSTQVTYTPNTDFNGIDSFTYVVSDGQGGSDSATVSIDVIPNDGSIFEHILAQIQSLFHKILNLEDEVTLLQEENSALALRITALESIIENGVPTDDDDDDNNEKILVCHKDKKTISISANGLSGHLKHGDLVGECSDNDQTSSNKEIKNQIKELKQDFKTQEKALKNDFKTQEKDLKKQLKDSKKDKKQNDKDDEEDDDD